MSTTILFSTFLLTILLAVGLFFFIKASVKERTEVVKLISGEPLDALLARLQEYFSRRAYRVIALDATKNRVTYEGLVRPSWFLAIFLSLLAASGILCLVLVLSFLFPQLGMLFLALEFFSPLAGVFYWQKAGRQERVLLEIEETGKDNAQGMQNLITVTGHRDELFSLRQTLGLHPVV